jgi:hypothetical protein
LQPLSPLRTVHDSFHSYGSSPSKAILVLGKPRPFLKAIGALQYREVSQRHAENYAFSKHLSLVTHQNTITPLSMIFRDTHLKPLPISGRRINLPYGRFPFAFLPKRGSSNSLATKHPPGVSVLTDRVMFPYNGKGSTRIQRATTVVRFSHHLQPYTHRPLLRSACR